MCSYFISQYADLLFYVHLWKRLLKAELIPHIVYLIIMADCNGLVILEVKT